MFEKDTQTFRKFTKALSSSCQKICNAQTAMIGANQELAYYLRLYGKQATSTEISEPAENSLTSTLNKFAEYIDEVNMKIFFGLLTFHCMMFFFSIT